ncbi:MAG: MFS transporter [Candidatus Omnitrophica bacterium]|nr:MFS transporter [Candidatus Omnitrophota bacterium]
MNKFFTKSSILSISLLTVMASAAISPALAKIKQAFPDVDPTLIKLVLTLPSLLIIPFSLLAGWLATRMKKKYVLLIGLVIYTIGGIGGAFARSITELLIIRGFFGIGAGLIIPLSTSLIADFYEGPERTKMMGLSGSVSHLGGVIFLLVSGWLACVSWRLAFSVYGLAVIIFLMVLFCLPEPVSKRPGGLVKSALPGGVFICAVLGALMMVAFYAAPTNLAMFIENERQMYTSQAPLFKDKEEFQASLKAGMISETTVRSFKANGITISPKASLAVQEPGRSWSITDRNKKYIIHKDKDRLLIATERLGRPGIAGYLLSSMTIVGVISGIFLATLAGILGPYFTTIGIAFMAIGYSLLGSAVSLTNVFIAMLLIGFSSGVLMPILLLRTARITPDTSRAFAMAVVSVGIYLGQFISPLVLQAAGKLLPMKDVFRAQFNFLCLGLVVASAVAFLMAINAVRKGSYKNYLIGAGHPH